MNGNCLTTGRRTLTMSVSLTRVVLPAKCKYSFKKLRLFSYVRVTERTSKHLCILQAKMNFHLDFFLSFRSVEHTIWVMLLTYNIFSWRQQRQSCIHIQLNGTDTGRRRLLRQNERMAVNETISRWDRHKYSTCICHNIFPCFACNCRNEQSAFWDRLKRKRKKWAVTRVWHTPCSVVSRFSERKMSHWVQPSMKHCDRPEHAVHWEQKTSLY